MVEKKRKRINWRELTAKAAEVVRKTQQADYVSLRAALGGIGTGTASTVLKRLEAKGVVRRGKQRHWIVIVNADGTPKTEIPEKRRFKKPRRSRTGKVVVPPVQHNPQMASSAAVPASEKQALLKSLAEHAEGRSKDVLLAILVDVATSSESTSILGLLKAKG